MQTELEKLARQYPQLSRAFAAIPQGEAHLRRLQDLNTTWQHMLLSSTARHYRDVVVTADHSPVATEDTFDIIYAGGGLNLLNAAVMTQCYNLRVLLFDRFTVGAVHREWNISREEIRELLEVGLLTPDELESVIQREYRAGLVQFHTRHIRVPAAELHLTGVLDVAVDADTLTALCMQKILAHQASTGQPNVVLHNTTFLRSTVQRSPGHDKSGASVMVDVSDASGQQHTYAARLLIDGMGSTSPIACQLNCGRPFSLVCPTVGTVARGYRQGNAPDAIDPTLGEVLVTTEDARNGRQLIWEAFPGSGDQVAIYLFHYAESGDTVNLLELFERFFELLPTYKDTSSVQIMKPVYGFIPAGYNISLPWQKKHKILAYDRVLSLGDAAAFQSPLTFCGFGSYVRNLRRITTLLALALRNDCLCADDLNLIRAAEAVPAVARAFSKFMIAKPLVSGQEEQKHVEPAWQVNETLNVFCRILNVLGPQVTSAFFKDRIGWLDYTRLVLKTPNYYPKIYKLAFSTLSLAEGIAWVSAWLQLGWQSAEFAVFRNVQPLLRSRASLLVCRAIGQAMPRIGLRVAVKYEAMQQVGRGRRDGSGEERGEATCDRPQRGRSSACRDSIGYWLGGLWPQG